jgi:glycosyltransferase involved in cell wall biosynthesis
MTSINRRVLVLSDSFNPWHSFWIRFGQYIPHLQAQVDLCQQVACSTSGLRGVLHGQVLPPPSVVLLYRFAIADAGFLTALHQLRHQGVHLIADIDDNLWQQGSGWERSRLLALTQALRLCHTVSCSTSALQQLLQAMLPAQRIQLLPNGCPAALLDRPLKTQPSSHRVRLGWTGAPWTRPHDLALLRPLAAWSQQQPDLEWVHVGACADRLSFAEAVGLPQNRVSSRPLVPYSDYLDLLEFEIGLAPMANNTFNSFKSELKLLEYSALGIPWLASDHGSYRELNDCWQLSGRLCASAEDWINGVIRLRSQRQRQSEGKLLQDRLFTTRPAQATINSWQQLLDHQPSKESPAASSWAQ